MEVVKRLWCTCEILCTTRLAGDFTTAVFAAKQVFIQDFVERLLKLHVGRAITSDQMNERWLKQEIEEFSAPRANRAREVALSTAVLASGRGACIVPELNGRRRDRAANLELLSGLCHLIAVGLSMFQLEVLGAGGLRTIGGALSKMERLRCFALTNYLGPEGAERLEKPLAELKTLQSLDLYHNQTWPRWGLRGSRSPLPGSSLCRASTCLITNFAQRGCEA